MTRAEQAARERGEWEREWHELFVREMREALNRLTDVTDLCNPLIAVRELIADLDLAREDYSRHMQADAGRRRLRDDE